MSTFGEASRRIVVDVARRTGLNMVMSRLETLVNGTGPAARYGQPVRLIHGMTAASEPCLLPVTWSEQSHPRNAVAQLKVDGMRALYIDTSIVTRQALPLDAALHCLPALHELEQLYGCKMVFDGEYQEPEGFQATLAAHKRGEGCGTIWLFDAVPYAEWKANVFTEPLEQRVARLCAMEEKVNSPFMRSLGLTPVRTASDAMTLAQADWVRGGEGIVVKDARSTYARGRSNVWQKLRQKQTFDGTITDLLTKDGRCQAIMVLMPLGSPQPGKVVRIGTNIPEDLREAMARAPDIYLGAVAEIGFSDTTDNGHLRGGYFIALRSDKGGAHA